MVDSGQQFSWVNWVDERCRASFIGFSVDVTTFDASSGDTGGIAVWPVIPAIIAIAGQQVLTPLCGLRPNSSPLPWFHRAYHVDPGPQSGHGPIQHGRGLILRPRCSLTAIQNGCRSWPPSARRLPRHGCRPLPVGEQEGALAKCVAPCNTHRHRLPRVKA